MSGPGDTVRRGPERWMRAAVNAAKNPNSFGARLYMTRQTNAFHVAQAMREAGIDDYPSVFVTRSKWTRDPVTPMWHHELVRDYVTCSVYCTTMQLQLVFDTKHLAVIDRIFKSSVTDPESRVRPLDRSTLKRTVRCQVCASEVKPL